MLKIVARWTVGMMAVAMLSACAPTKPVPTDHVIDLSKFTFDFDPEHGTNADIPPAVRALDGQRVTVEGFMIPMDESEVVTEFVLVPRLYNDDDPATIPTLPEQVVCKLPSGKSIPYSADRLRLQGTMHVGVVKDGEYTTNIFALDVSRVESAGQSSSTQP